MRILIFLSAVIFSSVSFAQGSPQIFPQVSRIKHLPLIEPNTKYEVNPECTVLFVGTPGTKFSTMGRCEGSNVKNEYIFCEVRGDTFFLCGINEGGKARRKHNFRAAIIDACGCR